MAPLLLFIIDLHERHPGLTAAVSNYYCEGAAVCLSRHHEPPKEFLVEVDDGSEYATVSWAEPAEPARRAWANEDDATRDGAYAMSLAAVEALEDLVAIGRAQHRTGADYFLVPKGNATDDFENSFRLEVSGTDHGTRSDILQRLLQKQEQTRRGQSDVPAIAAVVGFKTGIIALAYVTEAK